jgi:hypothetical protein
LKDPFAWTHPESQIEFLVEDIYFFDGFLQRHTYLLPNDKQHHLLVGCGLARLRLKGDFFLTSRFESLEMGRVL